MNIQHFRDLSTSCDLLNGSEKSIPLKKGYHSKLPNIMYKALHLVPMRGLINTDKDEFICGMYLPSSGYLNISPYGAFASEKATHNVRTIDDLEVEYHKDEKFKYPMSTAMFAFLGIALLALHVFLSLALPYVFTFYIVSGWVLLHTFLCWYSSSDKIKDKFKKYNVTIIYDMINDIILQTNKRIETIEYLYKSKNGSDININFKNLTPKDIIDLDNIINEMY